MAADDDRRRWLPRLAAWRRSPLQPRQQVELGQAWAGNSVNCVPFRCAAMLSRGERRWSSFYDADGNVAVAAIDLATGGCNKRTLRNTRAPYDAHQAISLGIDRRGLIHLAFGAHNSTLLLSRSRGADGGDGFEPPREYKADATYPTFLHLPDGELALLYRRGHAHDGAILVDRLSAGGQWQPAAEALLSGAGQPWSAGPYLNTPLVGEDGRVFLFLVWRVDPKATAAGRVANLGLDAVASSDGLRSLETLGGIKLSTPVTPLTAERVLAVPLGANLINQASACIMPDGSPAALTYWSGADGIPQYRFCRNDGSAWRAATVSAFNTRFRLDGDGTLPLPHSRPELLAHDDGRILLIYRSAECGNRLNITELKPPLYRLKQARHQTLVDQDLGQYEPVLDRSAWRQRREVALYVQSCRQEPGGDGKPIHAAAPARMLSWTWL